MNDPDEIDFGDGQPDAGARDADARSAAGPWFVRFAGRRTGDRKSVV